MRTMSVPVVLGILGCIAVAQAQSLQVNAGSHTVLAQPNQAIEVYVSGGAAIGGFDLALQVGDGDSGPVITAVDLESGIFQANNTGQTDTGSLPHQAFYAITTSEQGPAVIAEGLLLRLVLDASDVPQGVYALSLSGVEVSGFGSLDSVFLSPSAEIIPTQFIPGSITVVPEPSAALGAIALAIMPPIRRRRS